MKETEPSSIFADGLTGLVREPLLIIDPGLRVISASEAFYRLFGLAEEETKNRFIYDLGNRTFDNADLKIQIEKAFSEDASTTDFRLSYQPPAGKEKILLINIHRINYRDDTDLVMLAIAETPVAGIEDKLNNYPGLIHTIAQGIGDMIAAEDLNYNYIFFNEAYSGEFRSLWNYEISIGTNMLEAMAPWPEEQRKAKNLWDRALKGESFGATIEFNPSGDMQYYELRFNPLHDERGNVIGAVQFIRNVTREIQTSKTLEQERAELQRFTEERKNTEDALRRSEERWVLAIENFAEGVIIATEQEQVIYWNPAARRMHGFTRPDEGIEPLEKTPATFELRYPDNNQLLTLDEWPMRRIKRGEKVINMELRLGRPDQGWEKHVSYSGAMVETAEGDKLIFLSVYDLTEQFEAEKERKRAEMQLQSERKLLQTIIDSVPAMISIYDPQLRDITFNKEFYQITGWSEEELKGSNPMEIVYPDPEYREMVAEFMKSLTPGFRDHLMVAKDKRKIESSWANVSLPDGRQVGIGINITDRKVLEKQLENERDFVTAILQTSGALIIVINKDGLIIRFNKASEELTGYKEAEVQGHQLFDLFIPPEEKPEVISVAARLFSGESRVDFENHWLTRSGEKRFIRWRNSVLPDKAGMPVYVVATGIDLTDRRRIEEALSKSESALRESESRYRGIFNNVAMGICQVDTNDHFVAVNEYFCNMLGYTEEEILSIDVHSLTAPEDRELSDRMNTNIHNKILNRVAYEKRYLKADGSRLWVNVTVSSVRDEQDRHVGSVTTVEDITERKKVEVALRESEAGLKRTQEIAHLGSWELNLITNRLTWSDETYRIFGLKPGEPGITYQAFLDYVHPADRNAVDYTYTRSVKEGLESFEIEHRVIRKNTGEIRYVHEKCQHVRDQNGNIILSLGMVHDITDRKRAEEDLLESRERFAAAFRTVQDALLISDLQTGLIIDINQTWTSHWGYGVEESIGHRTTELGLYTNPGDRDKILQIIQREGRVKDLELSLRNKSGEIRNAVFFAELLSLPDQSLLLTIIHDITSQKQAENQLIRRTEELAATNKELEAFSYSVSHDLRSPLTSIHGFSTLLLENYGQKLDETGRSFLIHMINATNKMVTIIDDLLKMARISGEPMNFQKINLEPVAKSVIDELRKSEPGREVQVVIGDDIEACADPGLLTITLTNLLGNAWKYTGKNPHARIEFNVLRGNENIYFVRDNGAGFDMKYAYKLFLPFERLHQESEFTGTGIGLALVQKIIQRHGGNIWAESIPGEGATFYFTLRPAVMGSSKVIA